MADDSLDNLATGSSLSGDPLSLSPSGSSSSGFNWSNAGALGLGALGVGAILGQGEGSLPQQFLQAEGQVPWLQSTGQAITGQGQGLVAQGQGTLAMAEAGQLTPEQKAQLGQYSTGLTNQARQMYYSMGLNPDANTGFLSTTADIDAKVNAMAQQQIQTTIQLGLGEISGGNSLIGQGAGFESAANNILIQAGQAQLQQDKNYSDSLTNVFGSIAKIAGGLLKL